jgi:hypothetical protein
VVLLVPVVDFFALPVLFVRVVAVVFFVLPLVVRVLVFLVAAVDVPFIFEVGERREASSEVVLLFRVPLLEEAPFCSGFSATVPCCSAYSR